MFGVDERRASRGFLYRLVRETPVGDEAVVSAKVDSLMLLRRCLGHMSKRRLQILSNREPSGYKFVHNGFL